MNEREHIWRDAEGNPVLRHTKYVDAEGVKHFPWDTWIDFHNGTKPRWYKGKDPSVVAPLLYPMPEFVKANRSEHVHIVEGEADQEAAQAAGLLAVTAGPAGAFGREQARLFKGWRGHVTIVRDRDLAGAAGALKAYDALRAVGIPATRLRIARGRVKGEGADRPFPVRTPLSRTDTPCSRRSHTSHQPLW